MSETGNRWGVLLPALTFLVGLGLGLVIMLATGGSEPDVEAPTAEDSPSATASDEATGTPDTVVTVPGACEDAARNISEATRLLDDVAASIRDFQPEQLVDLLDQLEQLDAETRQLAEDCSAVGVTSSPSS